MINIRPILKEKDLDAILIFNPKLHNRDPAFTYFTGLMDYERALYIGSSTQRAYVASFEIPRAKKESFLKNIQPTPKKGVKNILTRYSGKTVGINGTALPLSIFKVLKKHNIKTKDVSQEIVNTMMVKTPAEISKLKKAIKLTQGMFKLAKNGKSELDIAADMAAYLVKNQAEFSFGPIISYGKNSALPHAKPTSAATGINLLCDIGAKWKGYHADITRNFSLKPDKKYKQVYEIVKEAHDLAIDAVEPGKTAKEIDAICRDHLKKNGYDLVHSTGHGIGLTIHEQPYISSKRDTVLKPGMVFTVEPGVYIKGQFGVRIEDDILVTKTGRQILSK